MRFFLPEGTLTRALFNISTWAVTQASNKLERGSDKAAQLGDDNISTAGNKKVPDGRNCIYKEVDFVSDNLCSYLFHPLLYLWGKHLHPWLWHAYTPPPFTCPLFTSSHHLPSMSYPQPQEDTAIKGWQCHWRQWPGNSVHANCVCLCWPHYPPSHCFEGDRLLWEHNYNC